MDVSTPETESGASDPQKPGNIENFLFSIDSSCNKIKLFGLWWQQHKLYSLKLRQGQYVFNRLKRGCNFA